jgi:hypothetical protein
MRFINRLTMVWGKSLRLMALPCFLLAAFAALCACSSSDGPETPEPPFTPRFAGYFYDGIKDTPCYWEGTTLHSLGEGLSGKGYAFSPVAVSGDAVFTAGYYNNGSRDVPCYWEGSVLRELKDINGVDSLSGSARATSIAVSGGKVYASGYYSKGAQYLPCYWEGTTLHELLDSSNTSFSSVAKAYSIAVSGGTVYTSGYFNYFDSGNSTYRDLPCYWEGVTFHELMDGSGMGFEGNSYAYSIAVSGGAVYTAGRCYNGTIYVPCSWQGTALRELKDSAGGSLTTGGGWASSIAVSNGTVYAAGSYFKPMTKDLPCYWVGDTMRELKDGLGNDTMGVACAMAVSKGTVYTAGMYYGESGSRPCYWEGSVLHELKDSLGNDLAVRAEVMSSVW